MTGPHTAAAEAGTPESPTRSRIIQAAATLFLERGYEGTSMADLARVAGITAPALYWHFASKDDLFIAFMESSLLEFVDRIDAEITAGPPPDQLRQLVHAYVRYQVGQHELQTAYDKYYGYGQLLSSLPARHRERLVAPQRRFLDRLRTTLSSGEAAGQFSVGNVTVTAFAIITICEYVFAWFRSDGRIGADELGELYGHLILNMVSTGGDT